MVVKNNRSVGDYLEGKNTEKAKAELGLEKAKRMEKEKIKKGYKWKRVDGRTLKLAKTK